MGEDIAPRDLHAKEIFIEATAYDKIGESTEGKSGISNSRTTDA